MSSKIILKLKKLVKLALHNPRRFIRILMAKITACFRQITRKFLCMRLKNADFTIIANNCVGGVMYHDLQHRFDSPTINLWFSDDDYFEFLNNLDYYLHSIPEEVEIDGIPYPVGRIQRDNNSILIYFMHYSSFSEACEKWIDRSSRVHMENLYVVFNYGNAVTNQNSYVKKFLDLDFAHKVMLTDYKLEKNPYKNIYHMPVYDTEIYPGKILAYKSAYSASRWLDDFDYVSFLNQK